MGARRARLRSGHPRPRPRPLPRSPPLPQGWGRPLPGPRGCLARLPRRGTDIHKCCQERKHVLLEVGAAGEPVGSGLGSGAVQVAAGARAVSGASGARGILWGRNR